jgi:hypothetical protein
VGRRKLQDLTADQLAKRFAELALSSAKAHASEATRLRGDLQEIEHELNARGADHHTDLLPLAGHPDETVRFEAVAATFRIALGDPQITTNLVRRLAIATDAPFVDKSSSAPRVARMSCNKLRGLTIGELVERFVDIAIAQDHASIRQETSKYNRLYDQMEDVEAELKGRDGDQRRVLLSLYEHPNAQVRLKAAIATLAVAPESARAVLKGIIDRNEYPQAADARGMMRALDEGTYTPT